MFKRKSILFVEPEYHCSFALRDELRKLGWRADVYISPGYPEKLLYKKGDFNLSGFGKVKNRIARKILNETLKLIYFFIFLFRYKYFLFYGSMDGFLLYCDRFFKGNFCLYLSLLKLFRKKILYTPSGCRDLELHSNFRKLDKGNVCNNCGYPLCEDKLLIPKFNLHKRYGDLFIGINFCNSTQFKFAHIKYKSLDLNLWHPNIQIPKRFLLPKTKNLRILHSFFKGGRTKPGKNIKGSPFVKEAIERLKKEGYAVEYLYVTDVPSKHMRYYQIQADIIVEQLIYGWWGYAGMEPMSLGKPVICYLRPSWKKIFFNNFPEYKSLPIVEATIKTIYEALKKLVINKTYREKKGKESLEFAQRHFDAKKNAAELEKVFLKL